MKLIYLLLFLVPYFTFAQPLQEFNGEREDINEKLMIGLGSWATANFIASGIGWAATAPNSEARYFHQMNVMWNTVNIGLAIPGFVKAKKANSVLTFSETVRKEHQTEKIFLINTGFDVGYMASGLILRSEAKSNVEKRAQFNGYGNSMLMQGGFLFLFDLTAYAIHNRHSKKSLENLLNSIELSNNGIGLKWHLEPKLFSRNQLLL